MSDYDALMLAGLVTTFLFGTFDNFKNVFIGQSFIRERIV
jgi:hypothetical protein